ncbi:MAG: hypothetical protein F6K28_15980 [Microcoleus sp. SIO2G3]|nr:hypothetical protein [Microcoleus sp. SIO2G3]
MDEMICLECEDLRFIRFIGSWFPCPGCNGATSLPIESGLSRCKCGGVKLESLSNCGDCTVISTAQLLLRT